MTGPRDQTIDIGTYQLTLPQPITRSVFISLHGDNTTQLIEARELVCIVLAKNKPKIRGLSHHMYYQC